MAPTVVDLWCNNQAFILYCYLLQGQSANWWNWIRNKRNYLNGWLFILFSSQHPLRLKMTCHEVSFQWCVVDRYRKTNRSSKKQKTVSESWCTLWQPGDWSWHNTELDRWTQTHIHTHGVGVGVGANGGPVSKCQGVFMDERWGEGVGRLIWQPCLWCTVRLLFMSQLVYVLRKYCMSMLLSFVLFLRFLWRYLLPPGQSWWEKQNTESVQ